MSGVSDMVCETHPDVLWPHDDCPGPGMPHPIITELRGVIHGYEQDAVRRSEAGSAADALPDEDVAKLAAVVDHVRKREVEVLLTDVAALRADREALREALGDAVRWLERLEGRMSACPGCGRRKGHDAMCSWIASLDLHRRALTATPEAEPTRGAPDGAAGADADALCALIEREAGIKLARRGLTWTAIRDALARREA